MLAEARKEEFASPREMQVRAGVSWGSQREVCFAQRDACEGESSLGLANFNDGAYKENSCQNCQ